MIAQPAPLELNGIEALAPVIELRAVEREFSTATKVRALGPLSLHIGTGEYVSVMGPSGSGKSTLLNLIGLLDRPTAGAYLFEGQDAAALSEAERTAVRGRRVGFVFQSFHLMRRRTTTENVALGMLYAGTDRVERDSRAREVLDRVGLTHRANAQAGTLSGGEQQRVAIARAVVAQPSLLLCDEPTGSLDQATGAAVLDLLGDLHADGMTICVITHDPVVAARASRTLGLRDGLLVHDSAS